ncbi:MAG: DUF819 family protein [Bacteroidales bacterium]|nr:DUF819 family protein [Bacteroidales bacterium]
MTIFNLIMLCLIFCIAPAGVLWVCKRVSFLGKIGPVLLLYILGVIIGNIGIKPEGMSTLQDIMSSAMVPLAIPMMLFGCTFRLRETKQQLKALVTGLTAVVIAVIIGYLIFGHNIDEGAKIGGMLTGVYTGGTINLAALKTMLGVRNETYILLNSYDMLVSFLYLTFLLTIGIKLFRKFLPFKPDALEHGSYARVIKENQENEGDYSQLFTKAGMKDAGRLLGITLLICAISGGVAILLPESMFMVIFILMLTTLGLICSFIKPIHNLKHSYNIGMYFIYIFCIVVASMADLTNLNLTGSLNLLAYLLFVVFGSLGIQALLARLFKIDADTMVIASVTFINSPPFVPMMAAAMKNRRVLVTGLTLGIIGYAVGNYLGFLISELLKLL